MEIIELRTLTASQIKSLQGLMKQLAPNIGVPAEMFRRTVEARNTHFFAMMNDEERLIGCASLCIFESPTEA